MGQVEVLPAGSLLNERYQIEKLIGKGGAGVVYKAIDLQTNATVAVKLLRDTDDYGSDSAIKQRQFFQREVALLQRVSHPNIIGVIDSGISEQSQLYLVMEFVDGVTLKSLMKSGEITIERAVRILSQISGALQAIHDEGIIHRDFKPHNVLVSGSGERENAKLLDFGIAKLIRGNTDESYLQTLTAKGVIAGTLHYMSPEQCQGRKLDGRTDIYSMGITAYEMVSGHLPFESNNPVSLIMQHLENAPPPIKNLPKNIEAVILKALEKNPNLRYARTVDFAEAFARAVKAAGDFNNNVVIAGDGADADDETQAVDTSLGEAPTLPSRQKTSIWDSMRRKFKF